MQTKNILMLCYYYPPLTDVGCKRSVAFSKYFQKHGWNPYVLSVKNPDKEYCSLGNEAAPQGVHTEYAYSIINLYWLVNNADVVLRRLLGFFGISYKNNHLYYIFCIPDHFIGWIPMAVRNGLRMIGDYDIDYIYVSCSPHSAAIAGILLKKFSGKPLVVDYRDPFHMDFFKVPWYRKKINRWLQEYFLKKADINIVNNEDTKTLFTHEYRKVTDKIFAVHNGFDEDFLLVEQVSKYEKFTITYTGDFYFDLIPAKLIFESIELLKNKSGIDKDSFQFLFYGDGAYEIKKLAKEHGIEDLVVANTRIPYKEVLVVLSRSHLQLLRIYKPMISTKLFEGIPLNVPFLATIPEGEVESIIRKYSPSSVIIVDQSASDVADAILGSREKYRENKIMDNDVQAFLSDYSRENLTLKLQSIVENNIV